MENTQKEENNYLETQIGHRKTFKEHENKKLESYRELRNSLEDANNETFEVDSFLPVNEEFSKGSNRVFLIRRENRTITRKIEK